MQSITFIINIWPTCSSLSLLKGLKICSHELMKPKFNCKNSWVTKSSRQLSDGAFVICRMVQLCHLWKPVWGCHTVYQPSPVLSGKSPLVTEWNGSFFSLHLLTSKRYLILSFAPGSWSTTFLDSSSHLKLKSRSKREHSSS
jgi:hypothetical protein